MIEHVRFRLEVGSGNAALVAAPECELARILRALAERLEAMPLSDHDADDLRDLNGNPVGWWLIQTERNDEEDDG